MAAYAAVASLMNNIEQIMNHPRLSTSFHQKQIQPLLQKAGLLLDFIEGYNHGEVMSKEVEDLERRIASAAHAAEDVIESHVVNQILAPSADDGETSSSFLLNLRKRIRGLRKKLHHLKIRLVACASHVGSSQARLLCRDDLQHIIEDMNAILKIVNELKEEDGLRMREEEQHTNSTRPLLNQAREADGMVGFEDELIQIMDELTNQRSSLDIISIVGMGGAGKTTLARNVYQNLLIKERFDVCAWANVSQQYNVQDILSQLLSGQGIVEDDDLELQLHKTLSGRRYLIVLDDLWSVEAWHEVRHFFPDNGTRSRVVLTTRLSNVARDCLSRSCFMIKPLDEQKSWELFCKKAFQHENCPYPEVERVGREIARLCRGLPLSTVIIGGLLLKSPRSLPFWEKVLSNIISYPNSKEKQESLDILLLSYNHLPPHLKPCFLYMGVFEEDSEIRSSRLINLWVAEGFLRPKNSQDLEVEGEGYLKELIDRNLVSVKKHSKNGKIGSCVIHDLVRDLCLKVGEEEEFFHMAKDVIRGTERRLICTNTSNGIPTPSRTRSILARSAYRELGANSKLLRVWETTHSHMPPPKFCSNVNLRYLAFDLPNPWSDFPSSISLLWNLQTLNIGNSWSNEVIVAPIEIWKLQQLKNVKCRLIYLPSDGSLMMMDKLQSLKTAVNLRLSKGVCEMIPNIKKLHLCYLRNVRGHDEGLVEFLQNLEGLHRLESLKLSVQFKLSTKLAFPPSLRKLNLSGCLLPWEDMWMVASLPRLEVLELGCRSMHGITWGLVDEQFLRLKYLEIVSCYVECWEADGSHFPVLEKLVLVDLWHLEEIPLGMGDIPTLEIIRVEYCSESAAISALKVLQDQMQMGNDGLQIQIRMFDLEMESFQERGEAEGLKLDNIQLEIMRGF